ncbi:hypothetical protein ATJ93_4777 [Halopiger aswanensis]|uniref:Uncharacterized protein n=1 Tax=Halopiger aswanensis TaxID=148449 RepID=A0A3R7GEN8_9EURY|nr:hypothetical protein ATJ93_4777 [Halopiger aswanensis]
MQKLLTIDSLTGERILLFAILIAIFGGLIHIQEGELPGIMIIAGIFGLIGLFYDNGQ